MIYYLFSIDVTNATQVISSSDLIMRKLLFYLALVYSTTSAADPQSFRVSVAKNGGREDLTVFPKAKEAFKKGDFYDDLNLSKGDIGSSLCNKSFLLAVVNAMKL